MVEDPAERDERPGWTYSYDANGNRSSTVDANGNATPTAGDGTTTYTYDYANRLTGISYSDSTPAVTYSYDAAGNRTGMGDGAGTQTYAYDNDNRLNSVTRGSDTFSYAYDAANNITSRTYPGQSAITYSYDNDNRLSTVTDNSNTTSYSYDPASNLTQTTLPSSNGYVESRTYDHAGRLVDVKNATGSSVLSEFAYTLDPVGNPTTVIRSGALSETRTYGYDANDRLTSVCFQSSCPAGSDPFIRWTYDKVGDRLTEERPSGTTNYTYDNAEEMTSAGSTTYSYDHSGNETAAGSRSFTYDMASRMISTTGGSTTTSYTYDGDGNRLQAAVGTGASQITNYLWDANGSLPQVALERDGSGTLVRRYAYGVRRISMANGGSTYYYAYDRSGSVTNLTSSSGASEWTYSYEPFGTIRVQTQDDPNAPINPFTFDGEQTDATGLIYLRARAYDSVAGRFLQLDPLSSAVSVPYESAYSFTGDRPTVMADPSGRAFEPSDAGRQATFLAVSPTRHPGDGKSFGNANIDHYQFDFHPINRAKILFQGELKITWGIAVLPVSATGEVAFTPVDHPLSTIFWNIIEPEIDIARDGRSVWTFRHKLKFKHSGLYHVRATLYTAHEANGSFEDYRGTAEFFEEFRSGPERPQ